MKIRFLFLTCFFLLGLTCVQAEDLYVLENAYQQLVISTAGGAIAEINLPFESKSDENSIVMPIEFDREMVEKAPFNARFPQSAYTAIGPDGKQVKNKEGKLGGYYPLLRRTVTLNKAGKQIVVPPRCYAANILSSFPELAELNYTVKEFTKNSITLTATQEQRTITKRISFLEKDEKPIPYMIRVEVDIDGDSKGIFLTSGVPEVELISGSFTPQLKYRTVRNNKSDIEAIDLPKAKQSIAMSSIYPNWISNSNGYFSIIIDPITEIGAGLKASFIPGNIAPSRIIDIDSQYQRYPVNDYPGYQLLLPLPSVGVASKFNIYAGPLDKTFLNLADNALSDPETGQTPDYSAAQSFQGWFSFISEPFAKFLEILMTFFYSMTHSWAAAIVLLTVALRIMLYPLNAWSFKSMRRMQLLAPEVTRIQERFKKEPKKAQMEVMNLYRERKVNPLTGCFPILIQIPFLMGMFDLLKSSFALRGAPFIPGWIDNLTAPDVLFSWGYPIPFIGTSFHLLPILLGLVMLLQQRLSNAGKSTATMTDQQRQQKAVGNIMVIVFTVMFYNFPSGLNLYWLCSMLLGVLQQWWTNKQLDGTPLSKA